MRTLLVFALAACGDNRPVAILLDAPTDAGVDACEPRDANTGCCALYPDVDAIRACAVPTFQPGSCGELACLVPSSCAFLHVNVCNLADAGTGDAP